MKRIQDLKQLEAIYFKKNIIRNQLDQIHQFNNFQEINNPKVIEQNLSIQSLNDQPPLPNQQYSNLLQENKKLNKYKNPFYISLRNLRILEIIVALINFIMCAIFIYHSIIVMKYKICIFFGSSYYTYLHNTFFSIITAIIGLKYLSSIFKNLDQRENQIDQFGKFLVIQHLAFLFHFLIVLINSKFVFGRPNYLILDILLILCVLNCIFIGKQSKYAWEFRQLIKKQNEQQKKNSISEESFEQSN